MAFKILAADTNISTLKALHLAFQDTDYSIYTSHDGVEALELFRQLDPDVAVFGLSLPRKNGYELAYLLRSREQNNPVPLILLLDAFDKLDEEKVKRLGHTTIISKPFDSESLAQKIRALAGETRDPETLPEEPELSSLEPPRHPVDSDLEIRLENKIRARIKEEILVMERELEKRIISKIKTRLEGSPGPNDGEDHESGRQT